MQEEKNKGCEGVGGGCSKRFCKSKALGLLACAEPCVDHGVPAPTSWLQKAVPYEQHRDLPVPSVR